MNSAVRPTNADDQDRIIELLTRVFSVDRQAHFVNPSLLQWKYWEPRADCIEPRSLVIEKNGRIVAHVGLWPVTIRNGGNTERGVHMIDWASETPGAGLSLLQRIIKSHDFVYSIGGSEITQSILPKFGFENAAKALIFARPIRPWRQIVRHPHRDVRLPLRLARNLWWSKTPARAAMPGWSAVEASDGEGPAELARERDDNFFRYLQRCPSAQVRGFHIVNAGKKSGYFALSIVGQQARLAGVWLERPAPECWRIAFQLAQDTALRHTRASEFVARIAEGEAAVAAAKTGMRLRGEAPVFLFRKAGQSELPLQFQICDNDSVFLASAGAEFLT